MIRLFLLLLSTTFLPAYGATFEAAPRSESGRLRAVASWLRVHGAEGFLSAQVADAMGIARLATEEMLAARQRGFRNAGALRVAQVSADARHDFMLFVVERPDDRVYFYFSTVREGLKKALVSIPSAKTVEPLDPLEAEPLFRRELRYWVERTAGPLQE